MDAFVIDEIKVAQTCLFISLMVSRNLHCIHYLFKLGTVDLQNYSTEFKFCRRVQ